MYTFNENYISSLNLTTFENIEKTMLDVMNYFISFVFQLYIFQFYMKCNYLKIALKIYIIEKNKQIN